MRRLIMLAAARRDLVSIDKYVFRASGSAQTARTFTGQLRGRCVHLASLPGMLGVPRPDLGQGLRSVSHKDYLIIFRYEPGVLSVVRVLEGHRDVDHQLRSGDS